VEAVPQETGVRGVEDLLAASLGVLGRYTWHAEIIKRTLVLDNLADRV
jgi:hypothetical protein